MKARVVLFTLGLWVAATVIFVYALSRQVFPYGEMKSRDADRVMVWYLALSVPMAFGHVLWRVRSINAEDFSALHNALVGRPLESGKTMAERLALYRLAQAKTRDRSLGLFERAKYPQLLRRVIRASPTDPENSLTGMTLVVFVGSFFPVIGPIIWTIVVPGFWTLPTKVWLLRGMQPRGMVLGNILYWLGSQQHLLVILFATLATAGTFLLVYVPLVLVCAIVAGKRYQARLREIEGIGGGGIA